MLRLPLVGGGPLACRISGPAFLKIFFLTTIVIANINNHEVGRSKFKKKKIKYRFSCKAVGALAHG